MNKQYTHFKIPYKSLAFMCVMLLGLFGCGAESAPVKAPNFRVRDIDGKSFALSDYKGKVVFLDFWATWCPPCVLASSDVKKIDDEYRPHGLQVLGLNLDDYPEPVRQFMASHHITARTSLVNDTDVPTKYQVRGIPSFFLIDQNGNIIKAWSGYNSIMLGMWRKEIERLLKS